MSRNKIELPQIFSFSTLIPVRITDLNYGGHVGNDAMLSLIHEARMQFLNHYALTEKAFYGNGLIMRDVSIIFKAECFYGDVIKAFVTASDFDKVGFNIYYKLLKGAEEREVAIARTGMICYNYETKKMVVVPEEAKETLST